MHPASTKHQTEDKVGTEPVKTGYQTVSGNYNKAGKPPAPFSSANHRLATGNIDKKRTKTQQVSGLPVTADSSEFKPGSAQTALVKNSMRASSNMQPRTAGTADTMGTASVEKSKLNIVAKKRPPPMNIGFNQNGIEQKRQVLYRNFHQI